MFGWCKKKEEPKVVEVKPELTVEERIKLFEERNSEVIKKFDEQDSSQIIFNVGDIVKLNVPNSPEMIVKSFVKSHYDIVETDCIYSWYSYTYDRELKFTLYRYDRKLILKYFDANLVLHEINVDPNEVIKFESN